MSFLYSLKNNLLKGFSVYLGSSIIKKAIPFFLLPILTRYLTTEEYGILSIYQVMITFSMPFIGMNMENNITRNFFSETKKYIARMVFNLILILSLTTVIFTIFIFGYLALGGEQFSIPTRWFYALPIIGFMNMVNSFNLTILRNLKKTFQFGFFEISRTAIDILLTITLIIVYSFGWEGRATGILVGAILMGVISVYNIWRDGYLTFKIDTSQLCESFKISVPLIPHVLGGVIITMGDRVFIDQMVSSAAVGVYSVAYQFGMIMTLVVTAFNRSWSPWMYELLSDDKDESKSKIVKATYLVSLGYVIIALLVTGVSYFLLPIMTDDAYHGGFAYIIWIAMGYAFNGMFTLVFPYGVYIGKTSYLGVITFAASIINLIANYYLIGINGPLGAAQATLISYGVMFIGVWWYSNKLYPMPWFNFKIKSKIN